MFAFIFQIVPGILNRRKRALNLFQERIDKLYNKQTWMSKNPWFFPVEGNDAIMGKPDYYIFHEKY